METSFETILGLRLRRLVVSVVIGTGAIFYLNLFTPAPEAAEVIIVSTITAYSEAL